MKRFSRPILRTDVTKLIPSNTSSVTRNLGRFSGVLSWPVREYEKYGKDGRFSMIERSKYYTTAEPPACSCPDWQYRGRYRKQKRLALGG